MSRFERILNTTLSLLLILVLVCCLLPGCGSGRKTGTVTGIAIIDGEVAVLVKLDDGSQVRAFRREFLTPEITGGQKVEVERLPNSKYWKVVRVLN
ncbi:MAG: hypothetical protein ABSD56_08400 [Bryobacteraceae bacterium]